MSQNELIQKLVAELIREQTSGKDHVCCKDGICSDGLCVIHNKEGVQCVVNSGASRITSGVGVDAAGGVTPDIARMIDHTLLKPEATVEQVNTLCAEAKKFQFASVCVNPSYVGLCAHLLKDTPVRVCTVVGFPLGQTTTETKAFETEHVIRNGATEVDMVINVGRLKSKEYQYVENDIFAVVSVKICNRG